MMKPMFELVFSSVDSITEIERLVYSATMEHGRGLTLFINDPENAKMQIMYEEWNVHHQEESSVVSMLEESCRSIIAQYDIATEYVVVFMQRNEDKKCIDIDFYHMSYQYIRPKIALTA